MMEAKQTIRIWQPMLRSQITPPTEILYHYIRLFSSQNKQLQVWHALRWLHATHTTARALDKASSSRKNVSTLKECVEKGWLFVTNPPVKRMTKEDVVVDDALIPTPAPEGFIPSIDLLYNYADQLASMSLTKTCWHLFEWMQTAFNRACKKDMNPYGNGRIATALKSALEECRLAASPRDVAYMPDCLKKRASIGFDERYVTVEVLDKLWDRLPSRFQIEILELGRCPETPRDRYGGYITRQSALCTHRKVSPPALLADGGCACPDREDVSWSELPTFEKSLFADPASRPSMGQLATDEDQDTMTDGESSVSSDVDEGRDDDQDSAYESDEDDTDNGNDGDSSSRRCLALNTTGTSTVQGTKVVLRVTPTTPQLVDYKTRQWFLRTITQTQRKRVRAVGASTMNDDDSDDETERRDSKRRHF